MAELVLTFAWIGLAILIFSVLFPSPAQGPTGKELVRNTTNYIMSNAKIAIDFDPNDFKQHEKDTGSADYQIAILTKRIKHLTAHMGEHKKDFASRRGLLTMVAQRRKLLDYLKGQSEERYAKLIAGLGLRR